MATIRWRGGAQNVAQVSTATPANVEVGDVFTLTINGKSIGYTAQAATAADVVAGLVAAWQASTEPEHLEIVAADTGGEVTLTALTPGKPFSVTAAALDGGGADTQTLTLATPTPSSGASHWDCAANWSGGAVPSNADDVYLEDSDATIRYGLDQAAVNLASLNLAASFTGEIGLPRVNEDGSLPYAEYRDRFLAISAALVELGDGQGEGSGRILLDTGGNAATITVHRTGLSVEGDQPALLWKGDHAANVFDLRGGTAGVALAGGDTATLATLRASGGVVLCGAALSLTSVHCSGEAQIELRSAVASLVQSGGETILLGSGGIDSLNLDGGRLDYRSSGAIAAAALDGDSALLDFSADLRDRTVSDLTLLRGTVLDPHETVTWTGGIVPGTGVQAV